MNIRKKLVAGAAVVLPLAGLGALGLAQTASATVPAATLTCTNLAPNPAPVSSSVLGGTSFDNSSTGTTPGSNGMFFGANPGSAATHSAVTLLAQVNKNATSAEFTTKAGSALAISGQTFTVAGATGIYTVTSHTTPMGKQFPDIVTFTPALTPAGVATFVKAGAVVTIDDTTDPSYQRTNADASFTQSGNTTGIDGGFVSGDAGLPVRVAYFNTVEHAWTDAHGFTAYVNNSASGGSLTDTTTTTYTYEIVVFSGATQVGAESVSTGVSAAATDSASNTITWTPPTNGAYAGDTVSIYGRTILPNNVALIASAIPVANGTYTDTGSVTPSGAPPDTSDIITGVSSGNATLSEALTGDTSSLGNVMVTIGSTNVAPSPVYTDENYTLFAGAGGNRSSGSCYNDLGNSAGNFAPTSASLLGTSTVAQPNGVIDLEQSPPGFAGTITYPSTASGWLDGNGETANPTPSSTFTFTNTKYNLYVLLENAYTFADGSVHGEYQLLGAAKIGFQAYGVVMCSIAQLEAIQSASGPDANPTSPNYISPADASQPQPEYTYCDGGVLGTVSLQQEFDNLIVTEMSPTGNYASDGSPVAAVWYLASGPQGNTVI